MDTNYVLVCSNCMHANQLGVLSCTSCGNQSMVQYIRCDARNLVRQIRKRLNMRQCDLARITGLKQPNLSRIETGQVEPRVVTKNKIAAALQTTSAELFPNPIK